jgi:hypothetical protein
MQRSGLRQVASTRYADGKPTTRAGNVLMVRRPLIANVRWLKTNMSIIANYLRVPSDQMPALANDVDAFQRCIATSQGTPMHTDLDQLWDALAWLVSPSAREKAVLTYQWFLMAEGAFDGVPANPSDIPTDEMEAALKGGDAKMHPKLDFGYGPATVLGADDVRRVSDALSTVTHQQLVDKFDPPQMLGVHPDGWQHCDPSAVHEMLIPAFDRFREFINTASKCGESVVIYFN